MDKKEKEARLQNHEDYWNLVDKLREMSLDALDDLSVDDIISVLDRVKVLLIQQQIMIKIEDSQKQNEVDVEEEESEIESDIVLPPHTEIKAGTPFVNLSELEEGMRKGMLNN